MEPPVTFSLWVRLREKGGKRHEMPCHHNLEAYLQAYLDGGGIACGSQGAAVSHHRPDDPASSPPRPCPRPTPTP
jgi:hypothetical protein